MVRSRITAMSKVIGDQSLQVYEGWREYIQWSVRFLNDLTEPIEYGDGSAYNSEYDDYYESYGSYWEVNDLWYHLKNDFSIKTYLQTINQIIVPWWLILPSFDMEFIQNY